MNDWRLRLFPRGKREWGEAYLADSGDGRGFVRVVAYAWYLTIRRHPVKTIVITTSVLSAATGIYLAALLRAAVVASPDDRLLFARMIALFAVGLVLQGGYTLLYMTGKLSSVEPLSRGFLFAGEALAILLVLSGVGVWDLEHFGALTTHWVYGPKAVRALIVAQAVFTLYHFTVGQERTIERGRRTAVDRRKGTEGMDPPHRAKPIVDTLVTTGVMLLGLLIVAALATPRLWALAWMTVLASILPYIIFSLVMAGRGQSSNLYDNVIRSLAYVAAPSFVTFLVFIRTVTDRMGRYPESGLVIVCGGAVVGASLLTLWARRGQDKRRPAEA